MASTLDAFENLKGSCRFGIARVLFGVGDYGDDVIYFSFLVLSVPKFQWEVAAIII